MVRIGVANCDSHTYGLNSDSTIIDGIVNHPRWEYIICLIDKWWLVVDDVVEISIKRWRYRWDRVDKWCLADEMISLDDILHILPNIIENHTIPERGESRSQLTSLKGRHGVLNTVHVVQPINTVDCDAMENCDWAGYGLKPPSSLLHSRGLTAVWMKNGGPKKIARVKTIPSKIARKTGFAEDHFVPFAAPFGKPGNCGPQRKTPINTDNSSRMLVQNPGEDRVHGCHGCHMFAGFRCGFITYHAQYAHNLARIITISFATIFNHLSNWGYQCLNHYHFVINQYHYIIIISLIIIMLSLSLQNL